MPNSPFIHKHIVTLIALLAAWPAQAAENLLFGGAEASGHRARYAQIGVVSALPGSQMGQGWAVRGVVNGLTYKYRGGPGNVEADALGGELTAGYMQSGAKGWWSAFTGPSYRHTDLSPNDPTSDARGGNWGWMIQGEGEYMLSPVFKANLTGNYSIANNNPYWTRARLLYRLAGDMFVGPEGAFQGDSDYNAWQLGAALVGIPLDTNTQMGLKAGVRKTEDFSSSAYVGVEFGYAF